MLETITALKTNNSRKIPNYDPSLLEHMRRLMRALLHSKGPSVMTADSVHVHASENIKKLREYFACEVGIFLQMCSGPADENQLKISLSDLLNADQQGWTVIYIRVPR